MRKSRFLLSIEELHRESQDKELRLADIAELMGEQAHLVLVCILSLPFLQPVPLPGLSPVLGTLICFVCYYLYRHQPPYIPRQFAKKIISSEALFRMTGVADRIWRVIEKLVHPRWKVLHRGVFALNLNILVICTNAFLLALPLPVPLTNFAPALVIFVNALGQLEEDGLLVLVSYAFCLICFSYFIALAIGVQAGLNYFNL